VRRRISTLELNPILFLLALAFSALLLPQVFAEEPITHPFVEKNDIKSETCLKCHPETKQGKFVHSAIAMGCENCHQATSENKKTTITLIATGGDLCGMCHEAKKDPVLHGPYKGGQCLVCHDPHTGNYPDEIRAEVNALCLSCHGFGQPNVKSNPETKLVTLLGGQTVTFDDYRKVPKLELDRSGTSGHPIMGHPLTGKDPRKKDATLSCLSCHDPHSSTLPNLLPAGLKADLDLCAECHK
jgi:predicted CXXCH cytochrome family protein